MSSTLFCIRYIVDVLELYYLWKSNDDTWNHTCINVLKFTLKNIFKKFIALNHFKVVSCISKSWK